MALRQNGALKLTRHYLGGCYESDLGVAGTKEKLYIGGDAYSAPAVYVKQGSQSWQLYYICRDYLGSITHLVGSNGLLTQELSYDAWGSLRNPVNQAVYKPGSEPDLFLGRGYTGHEHLPWFGLINMNGRLYDPAPGRFLSPDNYVQAPDFSQSYNRYGYCLNNPLKYTDPSGEKWRWKWLNPIYWLSEGMQWINDNTTELRQKMTDIGVPDFNVGYNSSQGSFHSINNSGNIYHSDNLSHFNPAVNVERGLNQMRSSYGLSTDNLNSWDLAVDQGIRSSVSMGGAANFGIAEIDAYSGAATKVIYDAIPGGYWKDGMPIEVNYGNDILVVDNTNNAYRSIDDPIFTKSHRAYWNKNYIAASYTYPIKNFEAMEKGLHGWAQFAAPNTKFPYFFPLPDDFRKSVNDYSNYYEARERKKKFYYYRKAGIIY